MSDVPSLKNTIMKSDRFKALSDGVFSIALTLLIIDVVAVAKEVEPGTNLASHLIHHWGTGAAYLIGFVTAQAAGGARSVMQAGMKGVPISAKCRESSTRWLFLRAVER